jgi:iron complex transport system substrate-binding protein
MKKITLVAFLITALFCVQEVLANGKKWKEGFQATGKTNIDLAASQTNPKERSSYQSRHSTIIDTMGRKVTLKHPVKRVAFSHPATADALMILDAWNLVAGRCMRLDEAVFPDLDKISVIKSGQNIYELNYEKVYEAGIDLFLAANLPVSGFDEMVSNLEPNIPVAVLDFHDASQLITNLEKLGILIGREKEAEAYSKWFNTILEMISRRTKAVQKKPKVFFKTGWGKVDDIQTFTDELSGISERNEITGCINIAAKLPSRGGWVPAVDTEWLVSQETDVLIIMDSITGGLGLGIVDNTLAQNHRQQVMALPVFSGSKAVKNNQVYVIPVAFYATPQFIVEYAYLAKWFHPELFSDLKPKAIHQEYLTIFMRIDNDLARNGVFVYPDK